MSVTHNFNIEQGSDFTITFVYQDAIGNPIDLSNGKVGFRFRGNNTSIITEYVRGQPNGYVSAGNIGEIVISFPAAVTRNFTFNTAVYDLDFEPVLSGPQQNTRIATGTITLVRKNFNTFLEQAALPSTPDTGGGAIPLDDGAVDSDRCSSAVACLDLDIYSRVYNGRSIIINDNTDNYSSISGVVSRQTMQKIEVAINGLKHDSPQDLTFLLKPPSGDTILLSSNNKISEYDPDTQPNGFNFVFTNSASPNIFLNNVPYNGACNIDDKTDIVKYSTDNLVANFDHLLFVENHEITGIYTLYVNDTDLLGSGTIDSWNLIITYTGAI